MPSSSPFLTVGMTSVTIATVGRMFTASPAPIDRVSNPASSGTRSGSAYVQLRMPGDAAGNHGFKIRSVVPPEIVLTLHGHAKRRIQRVAILFIQDIECAHKLDRASDDAGRAKDVYRQLVGDSISEAKRRNGESVPTKGDVAQSWSAERGAVGEPMRKVHIERSLWHAPSRRKAVDEVVCGFIEIRLCGLRRQRLDKQSNIVDLYGGQLTCECRHRCATLAVAYDIYDALSADS